MGKSLLKRCIHSLLTTTFIFFLLSGALWADTRTEPIDIIVALDKSLSMEATIRAVKDYVNKYIVDQFLQKGDYFLLISFFGATEIVESTYVKDETHKAEIKQQISKLGATGHYTDIGNALDRLKEEVDKMSTDNRRKTLLLITDGKDNPIPGSRYYTGDGGDGLNHPYLKNKSERDYDGWKLIYLDLGQAGSRELADSLEATYIKKPENVKAEKMSAEELKELVPELAGTINILFPPAFTPVGESGDSVLSVDLETKNFQENPQLTIDGIKFESANLKADNILKQPYSRPLSKAGKNVLAIRTHFAGELKPGLYMGQLTFNFTSKDQFAYGSPVQLKINTYLENNPWVVPAVIGGALVLLALLVLAVIAILRGNSIKFKLVVEERPLIKGKDIFTATKGKPLYITESLGSIRVTDKKVLKSMGKLTAESKELKLTTLKEVCFPEVSRLPKDVLGTRITVRTEDGERYHIRFENI